MFCRSPGISASIRRGRTGSSWQIRRICSARVSPRKGNPGQQFVKDTPSEKMSLRASSSGTRQRLLRREIFRRAHDLAGQREPPSSPTVQRQAEIEHFGLQVGPTRILPGLRSRWITWRWCSNSTASATLCINSAFCRSVRRARRPSAARPRRTPLQSAAARRAGPGCRCARCEDA